MQAYKDYFFSHIGSAEGLPAPSWKAVLEALPRQGFGTNPRPGEVQPEDAPNHGITVMIDTGGNARGRIWLPTDSPVIVDGNAWFTHEIQVIADGPNGGMVWAWDDKGGAPVRAFTEQSSTPEPPAPQPTEPQPPASSDGRIVELLDQMVEEQRTTNRKLDEQRTSVEKAAQQITRSLAGGLLGGLGRKSGRK